jgi:hypothetical protein
LHGVVHEGEGFGKVLLIGAGAIVGRYARTTDACVDITDTQARVRAHAVASIRSTGFAGAVGHAVGIGDAVVGQQVTELVCAHGGAFTATAIGQVSTLDIGTHSNAARTLETYFILEAWRWTRHLVATHAFVEIAGIVSAKIRAFSATAVGATQFVHTVGFATRVYGQCVAAMHVAVVGPAIHDDKVGGAGGEGYIQRFGKPRSDVVLGGDAGGVDVIAIGDDIQVGVVGCVQLNGVLSVRGRCQDVHSVG